MCRMSGEDTYGQAGLRAEPRDRIAAATAEIKTLLGGTQQIGHRTGPGPSSRAYRDRVGELERRAEVDGVLIAELRAEGLLSRQHAEHLEEALRSSRKIGAAIGIVMTHHNLNEQDAFELLREASMNSNRKLRSLAEEVVLTGDVSLLEAG